MAKKLNTTVHLTDDKGRAHVFGPNDELPGWAEKHLAESWGDDRDDLWEAAASPEELSVKEALETHGTPPPDRGPLDSENPSERDQQAIDLGNEVKDAEAAKAVEAQQDAEAVQAAEDDGDAKRRGRK